MMLLSIILAFRAADRAALRCLPICVAAVPSCIRTGAKLQGTMQLDKGADALHSITSWAVVEKGACQPQQQQQQQQPAVSSGAFNIQQSTVEQSALSCGAFCSGALSNGAFSNGAFRSGALSIQQWGIQPSVSQQWGIELSAFSSGVVVHSAVVHKVVASSSGAFSSGAFSIGAFSIQQGEVQLSAFSSGALSPQQPTVEHSTFSIQHYVTQIRLGTCRAPLKSVVV